MKTIQKTFKNNGLRLVMVPQADAATAAVFILVGTGSNYEQKKENGLSHFLEHMYFKGTAKRSTARVIAETFDGLGALSNAFTTKEYTGYYAKGNPAHTDRFIDILSDIYLHSTFPEMEIEKEKGVVIEEINMYEDMPQYKVWENLFAMMYGDQPAGRPTIGPKSNIMNFTRADLLRYRNMHYTPANTIVVVAGAIDSKAVERQVGADFADAKSAPTSRRKKTVDTQQKPQALLLNKKTDQTHLVLGFRSLPIRHSDRAAVSLLSTLLGGGMSSRLFLQIREELGAAYYIHTDQEPFIDHGVFSIAAGIDKNRFTEIMRAIVVELQRVKTELVTETELKKVKEQTIGMLRLGLESSDSVASFYGLQLLLKGEYKTTEQLTKEYMGVTAADIQRVAKKIFVAKHANLSVVGPVEPKVVNTELLKHI